MLKRILLMAITCLCWQLGNAETCPKVYDIKHSALSGWKAYDIDDDKPLSITETQSFRHAVEAFVLAEWSHNQPKGSIHCHYRDKSGSNLGAYLAKDHFHPKQLAHHFWYPVSGHMHCAASTKKCEFESEMDKKVLARK